MLQSQSCDYFYYVLHYSFALMNALYMQNPNYEVNIHISARQPAGFELDLISAGGRDDLRDGQSTTLPRSYRRVLANLPHQKLRLPRCYR